MKRLNKIRRLLSKKPRQCRQVYAACASLAARRGFLFHPFEIGLVLRYDWGFSPKIVTKFVVQADANHGEPWLERRINAGRAVVVAELDTEIFELERPARIKCHLGTAAVCPAGRCLRGAIHNTTTGTERISDTRECGTACYIKEGWAGGSADAAT